MHVQDAAAQVMEPEGEELLVLHNCSNVCERARRTCTGVMEPVVVGTCKPPVLPILEKPSWFTKFQTNATETLMLPSSTARRTCTEVMEPLVVVVMRS